MSVRRIGRNAQPGPTRAGAITALWPGREHLRFRPVPPGAEARLADGPQVHESFVDVPGARLPTQALRLPDPKGLVIVLQGNSADLEAVWRPVAPRHRGRRLVGPMAAASARAWRRHGRPCNDPISRSWSGPTPACACWWPSTTPVCRLRPAPRRNRGSRAPRCRACPRARRHALRGGPVPPAAAARARPAPVAAAAGC